MIITKKELNFYIMADRIMNGYSTKNNFVDAIKNWITSAPPLMKYLYHMRFLSYYINKKSVISQIKYYYHLHKVNKLSTLLGVSIAPNVCRYGLVVPHYGTLIIGNLNTVGRYAVFHTMVNLTASNIIAGDGLYMAVGSKIIGPAVIGDNVMVAANSVVKKDQPSNVLLAGMPAIIKKENLKPWYVLHGKDYARRVAEVETLRVQLGLPEDV